jgi:hypothetical protein
MSRLPTPDRGQPIDVPYIYQIATAINSLADQIDASAERYTTIYNRETRGPQDLRTSNARFVAYTEEIFAQTEVIAGQLQEFSISIEGFKFPPVVTATPFNSAPGASTASNDVFVVLTSISNSEIRGFVRFNSAGLVSISVNVIAIGVPE